MSDEEWRVFAAVPTLQRHSLSRIDTSRIVYDCRRRQHLSHPAWVKNMHTVSVLPHSTLNLERDVMESLWFVWLNGLFQPSPLFRCIPCFSATLAPHPPTSSHHALISPPPIPTYDITKETEKQIRASSSTILFNMSTLPTNSWSPWARFPKQVWCFPKPQNLNTSDSWVQNTVLLSKRLKRWCELQRNKWCEKNTVLYRGLKAIWTKIDL